MAVLHTGKLGLFFLPNSSSVIKHPRGCLCLRAPLTARAVGERVEVPFLRISQNQS